MGVYHQFMVSNSSVNVRRRSQQSKANQRKGPAIPPSPLPLQPFLMGVYHQFMVSNSSVNVRRRSQQSKANQRKGPATPLHPSSTLPDGCTPPLHGFKLFPQRKKTIPAIGVDNKNRRASHSERVGTFSYESF
ncbi:UNVERIFIED_CONTAM: hypothetical protein RMT77_016917 [Armadillidium vulgare]